jgi:hypothetical protein
VGLTIARISTGRKNMALGPLPPAPSASFHQFKDDGCGVDDLVASGSRRKPKKFGSSFLHPPRGEERDSGKRTMGVGLTHPTSAKKKFSL